MDNYVNYDPTRSYGLMDYVSLYGCVLESLIDNNTYVPMTWDGDELFTLDVSHWRLIRGNPKAWAATHPKPAASTGYPYNGMGRVVLKKNMIDVAEDGDPANIINLLTQNVFEDGQGNPLTNTVFVIQYDFVVNPRIVTKTFRFTSSQASSLMTPEKIRLDAAIAAYDANPTAANLERRNQAQADFEAIGSQSYYYWVAVQMQARHALHLTGRAVRLDETKTSIINTTNGVIYAENDMTVYIGCLAGEYSYLYDTYITIPQNCTIMFDGGTVADGGLHLQNTTIAGKGLLFKQIHVLGTICNDIIYTKWFDSYIFENINNLLVSGKTFIFENKEYECGVAIKFRGYDNVSFDFCGATIKDNIDSYERELGTSVYQRYSPFIFAHSTNGLVIRNLNYLARISPTNYDWYTSAIQIGKTGYDNPNKGEASFLLDSSNILIENCSFTDRNGSRSNIFGCISVIGGVCNICIKNISVNTASFNNIMNFEYGAKDTSAQGGGKHPSNIHVNKIFLTNLTLLTGGAIRTGGASDAIIENIFATDVQGVFELFSGDDGNNTADGVFDIRNVEIKYTENFDASLFDGNRPAIFISNVTNFNGTSHERLLPSWVRVVNNYQFTNIIISRYHTSNQQQIDFRVENNRGSVTLDNVTSINSELFLYMSSDVRKYADETTLSNDYEITPGCICRNCKVVNRRGNRILSNIKSCTFEDFYFDSDLQFVEYRGSTEIELIFRHCCLPGPMQLDFAYVNSSQYPQAVDKMKYSFEDSFIKKTNSAFAAHGPNIKRHENLTLNGDVYQGERKSGTFANKPDARTINIGYAYYCSDKQSAEGFAPGMMIYHQGSDVWVDALGRTIS